MLACEMATVGVARSRSRPAFSSSPTRNMYRMTPSWAITPRYGRDVARQQEARAPPAQTRPSSDGPSRMPATTSPMTGGWPRYRTVAQHAAGDDDHRQGQQHVHEDVRPTGGGPRCGGRLLERGGGERLAVGPDQQEQPDRPHEGEGVGNIQPPGPMEVLIVCFFSFCTPCPSGCS